MTPTIIATALCASPVTPLLLAAPLMQSISHPPANKWGGTNYSARRYIVQKLDSLTLLQQISEWGIWSFTERPQCMNACQPIVECCLLSQAMSAQKDPARIRAPGVEHGCANVAIRMGRTRPHRTGQNDSVVRSRGFGMALSAIVTDIGYIDVLQ